METKREEGIKLKKRHRKSCEGTMRGEPPLNTPQIKSKVHDQLSSIVIRIHHQQRRSLKRLMLEEFKKENPPSFDGEMKKEEEEESWLLGLNKYYKNP